MNDIMIIDLYYSRNEQAIKETDIKYGKLCFNLADNILRNHQDSEECVNDTFLGAWNSIPPQKPENLPVYLGKITRNLALNRYKRNSAVKRGSGQVEIALSELENCIPDQTGVDKTVEEKLLAAAINRFLHTQSKIKRNIFVRRYWYLYSIKEIADAYEMSESKVKSVLFRMRYELKEHLVKEEVL